MYKKILIPLITVILIACNNSSNETKTTNDSTEKKMSEQDTTHSMNMTTNVPELPAIPEGAKVYFKNLKNNATVSSPLRVEMGIENIKIDTAGPVVAGSGHHHLFIDAEDSLAAGTIVPKDPTHLHFGKGQTFVDSLKLSPGKHKLTLQFADGLHRSYGSKLATTININVK
ncbi:MAG TPA: DUF4399 domain-containing protein [Chitinophagaceae bacterium]|jgi:hypothetical protein|nr:DUF4399 domain-containing protein [Chitinophagaceae bacterium]